MYSSWETSEHSYILYTLNHNQLLFDGGDYVNLTNVTYGATVCQFEQF